MIRPISLTLRLTLLFSAAATIGFLTFGWIIGNELNEHFNEEDINELRVIAQGVEQSLSTLHSHDNIARIEQRFDDLLVGHHGALLRIIDSSGRHIYASPGPDFSAIPLPENNDLSHGVVRQWNDPTHHFSVLIHRMAKASPTGKGPYTVFVGVATDSHTRFLTEFRVTLWLMIFSGIVVMGLVGWIAVRHGHRPLHRMVEQVSRISANDLDVRLDPNALPVEITELALSFNELLQRLEESFNRLNNFSADIAHELRTPITNLMTQTQVAISQARGIEEYQEILYSNMEEYERMAQMISDMLFLAKADNGLAMPDLTTVDLAQEIHNLFDYYEAWAEERKVSLKAEGSDKVVGDKLMLRRALSNLLSNAIRHTPENHLVTATITTERDKVHITIHNPGTPLATEHLNRIFDRFYRVDPSRQHSGEGAGLGLAIAKSIIEAHSGSIVAASDENGTQFTICLPIGLID